VHDRPAVGAARGLDELLAAPQVERVLARRHVQQPRSRVAIGWKNSTPLWS
jgi:hypothetical protein